MMIKLYILAKVKSENLKVKNSGRNLRLKLFDF
jgi:hypothetical protein